MGRIVFDDDLAKQLESVYRTRDILRRRAIVRDALAPCPGERIVDVGCGPGFYVAELLDEVGPEGFVIGVDLSPQMLAVAAARCAERPNVAFHEADATSLPAGDEDFDAAICVQVLEYVPSVDTALAEIYRVLRPGGRVVVWDVDWTTVSWQSSDPGRTERVLRAWDGHLAHPALPRTLAARLRSVGFEDVRAEGHAFATTELIPDAYGGALFPLVEDYVTGTDDLSDDEARAWADDQRDLVERGEFFFSCTQLCFTAARPAGA